jgi:hypothetical protein
MSSIKHSARFDISQPVERVFPLFSPEGEKRWAPNWDYENIMGTTELSEDYVFLTGSHDHASTHAIWLVKRYVPKEWFIEFYRVEPEDKIGVVTVQCSRISECITHVEVTYQYIPLSERGRKFVDGFTVETYGKFIAEWRNLLIRYFESEG